MSHLKVINLSVVHLIVFFRFDKADDMFKMKSAGMIYTGNCIKLARSPYILVPKMVDVNDVKPCKNVHTDSKSVAEFYDKKSVVITGANGFIGTILVSKLLRSCPGLETIYFLIREKKWHQHSNPHGGTIQFTRKSLLCEERCLMYALFDLPQSSSTFTVYSGI